MAGVIEEHGITRLLDTLDAAGHELDDLEDADRRAGSLLGAVVRKTAPRLTGALSDSTAVVVTRSLVEVTAGNSTVDYAPAVHKRNPWMTRAASSTEAEVVAIYQQAVADVAGTIQGA